MYKKYTIMGTIWILLIVAGLVTNSFFPAMVRENLDLHETYEYSKMYLEDDSYTDLIIEYDYVDGFGPSDESIDLLEQRVAQYTEKDSIVSKINQTISPENTTTTYNKDHVVDLMEKYQSYERKGQTITVHVLYLNGDWEENKEALGLSRNPYQMVIFQKMIRAFSRTTSLGSEEVESGVLVHEFGHLLSLVGIDYQTFHEDSVYPNHCNEQVGECVMAGSVEQSENGEGDPPPTHLCDLCEEDIERIKGLEGPIGFEDLLNYGVLGGYALLGIGISVTVLTWKDTESHQKSREPRYEERYTSEKSGGYDRSSDSEEDEDIYY